MTIHYLLYASRLVEPIGYDGLTELLDTSQRNNRQSGLTGFLHIEDRIVLQYLEGPAETLECTIDRIRRDPRHTGFVTLSRDKRAQRNFDDWQMTLVENATLSLSDLLGVQIKDVPTITNANPIDLIAMLSANASFLRHRPSVA